jgi:hypothetical protein
VCRRESKLWQGEPDCWRDYPGPYGEQVRLKPDAFAILGGQDFEDMAPSASHDIVCTFERYARP